MKGAAETDDLLKIRIQVRMLFFFKKTVKRKAQWCGGVCFYFIMVVCVYLGQHVVMALSLPPLPRPVCLSLQPFQTSNPKPS